MEIFNLSSLLYFPGEYAKQNWLSICSLVVFSSFFQKKNFLNFGQDMNWPKQELDFVFCLSGRTKRRQREEGTNARRTCDDGV